MSTQSTASLTECLLNQHCTNTVSAKSTTMQTGVAVKVLTKVAKDQRNGLTGDMYHTGGLKPPVPRI